MFSYVDSSIRESLEKEALMKTLDSNGVIVLSNNSAAYLSLLGPVPIPRLIDGEEVILHWYPFVRRTELSTVLDSATGVAHGGEEAFRALLNTSMLVNSVLAFPGFEEAQEPLVRVHSCCLTGDVFGSYRCDCGEQLKKSMEMIEQDGKGVLLYLYQEGRGIGIVNKMKAYALQDQGKDTVQANEELGFKPDLRDYGIGAQILRKLGLGKIRIMTNNPRKIVGLEGYGLHLVERVHIEVQAKEDNIKYLRTKQEKMGHMFQNIK